MMTLAQREMGYYFEASAQIVKKLKLKSMIIISKNQI